MSSLYTVYGVDRAGVPWECRQTDSPAEVVALLSALRFARSPKTHAFGVYLTDDPERGDVEDVCEEELEEAKRVAITATFQETSPARDRIL